eukprot:g1720.t1
MNHKSFEQARNLVKASYISQGEQALNGRRKQVTALLSNRRLPARGWDDAQIEYLLTEISLMDSNNFSENVGVGEREGRVYSGLVARRNYRLSHGVGRSGDVAEVQPKAAGSSLLAKLAHALARDALRLAGLGNARACLVLPMATGMSLALTLAALRAAKPAAKAVVWPRMDQKSCLKAIVTAGFTPVVVENLIEGDAVVTDVEGVRAAVERCGADNVLCVVTTTSCFAPRMPDKVDAIARVCDAKGVGHVINNAYGVQCSQTCRLINRAMSVGRVDAVVQSTDKNFLVPVGGAVVCGPDAAFIEQVGKSYAGRASSGPCLDLFITLLSMGEEGWRRLLAEREALVEPFRRRLREVAESNGERLLESSGNNISFAVTLDTMSGAARDQVAPQDANGGVATSAAGAPASAFLGSMLFTRCVSGTRVVPRGQHKSVGGVEFTGYGASVSGYPHDYLTAACAVGLSVAELDEFVLRFDKTLRKVKEEGKGKREKAAALAHSPDDARVGTGTATATAIATGVETSTGVAAAVKASQGNGDVENGQHSHSQSHTGPVAEAALNGGQGQSQSQPETEICLPETEIVDAQGDSEDWDGVD